jgi:hypothetical protein
MTNYDRTQYLQNHPHFIQGKDFERERIIELISGLVVVNPILGSLITLIKVGQPEAEPENVPELFPGFYEELDKLTIRPTKEEG